MPNYYWQKCTKKSSENYSGFIRLGEIPEGNVASCEGADSAPNNITDCEKKIMFYVNERRKSHHARDGYYDHYVYGVH